MIKKIVASSQTTSTFNDRLHDIITIKLVDISKIPDKEPTLFGGYDSLPSPPSSPPSSRNPSSEENSSDSSKLEGSPRIADNLGHHENDTNDPTSPWLD